MIMRKCSTRIKPTASLKGEGMMECAYLEKEIGKDGNLKIEEPEEEKKIDRSKEKNVG